MAVARSPFLPRWNDIKPITHLRKAPRRHLDHTPEITKSSTETMIKAMSATFRSAIYMVLFMISYSALGADAYHDFVSDLFLNESHQAKTGLYAIQYRDPQNGQTLRSVLDPNRAIAALKTFGLMKRDSTEQNLLQALTPVLSRYEKAFSDNPKLYEAEYLDCLEISASMILANSGAKAARAPQSASSNTLSPENMEKMNKLMQSLNGMMDAVARATARSIREKIEKNVFSPAGAQRASKIADSLSPQQ